MAPAPQVMEISLANEKCCEAFKEQFQKFDYLWTKDLQVGVLHQDSTTADAYSAF